MVDYADIGKRIRACRLAKGMTQEQLANEVGVVVTHISHIETGNSVPSLKTLIDIINALDCSADELLCIEIKKAKPVFDSWMSEQLADCSADEAKIIKETVVSLKKSLRKVYGKSSKYTPTSLLMRRPFGTDTGTSGRCHVQWALTFRWATISARLPSCSRWRTDISG